MSTTGIFYDMTAEQYHSDPTDQPSLSSSIAKILCTQSPLHAWTAHPKLNPAWSPNHSDVFDRGQVAHALLLEGVDKAQVIAEAKTSKGVTVPFPTDWRLDDAQKQRDEARANGKVPMLQYQYDGVLGILDAIRGQLKESKVKPAPFTAGRPEATLVWEDEGVLCRARLDWLHESLEYIDDFKTLADANPETIARKSVNDGWDIQAAFYVRGVEVLAGIRPKFRFVACEAEEPFALSVFRAEGPLLELGERKRRLALEIFRDCLKSGAWPAYPATVQDINVPDFVMDSWLKKEEEYAVRTEARSA